jgi:hypothetical protein
MKLRDLPQGSTIRVSTDDGPKLAVFDHLDGSYSRCHLAADSSQVFHLGHATPMSRGDDGVYAVKDDRSN